MNLIFPNEKDRVNVIKADTPLRVPPLNSDWKMLASEPKGRHLVVALVTGPFLSKERMIRILKEGGKDLASDIEGISPVWGSAKSVITIME